MRNALECSQRFVEGLALRDVFPGFFEHHARDGQHLQALEHMVVANTLDAQTQVGRIRSAARFGERDGERRFPEAELLVQAEPVLPRVPDRPVQLAPQGITLELLRRREPDVGIRSRRGRPPNVRLDPFGGRVTARMLKP